MDTRRPPIYLAVITGYSGAGKTTVLKALEDAGFFCVDNLPLALYSSFFKFLSQRREHDGHMSLQKVALGIDVRVPSEVKELLCQLEQFKTSADYQVKVAFLTASDQVLIKRFQETRRKHPLVNPLDLTEAIAFEKDLLTPLKAVADVQVDTDQLSIHELRTFVRSFFVDAQLTMVVSALSFGFKYGVPTEANFVYDLRALPNPYFVPELKLLSGTDPAVRDYLFSQQEVQEYWERLKDFISYTLEKSYREGRFFVSIAFGCTGGRHRSVAFAHELSLLPIKYATFVVKHRDILKDIQS